MLYSVQTPSHKGWCLGLVAVEIGFIKEIVVMTTKPDRVVLIGVAGDSAPTGGSIWGAIHHGYLPR